MGRWLPPTDHAEWTERRCPRCGSRVVVTGFSGAVAEWCENHRGWVDGLDNVQEPDTGQSCNYVLFAG